MDNNLDQNEQDLHKPVEVDIFGQKYTIRGDKDVEYTKRIAEYVDEKMWEVYRKLRLATPLKVAVMTALNIAHELFSLRENIRETDQTIAEETDRLIRLVTMIQTKESQPTSFDFRIEEKDNSSGFRE